MVDGFLIWLFAQVPWLNIWPLKQITTGLVKMGTNKLYDFMKLVMDVTTIRLANPAHQAAFDESFLRLKVIIYAKGMESDEYKEELEKARSAMSRFTRVHK